MTFTDYFGNPLDVGDVIVRPVSVYNSAPRLERATIEKIVPLVADPADTSANPSYLVRQDQLSKSSPTRFRILSDSGVICGPSTTLPDPQKQFVLTVRGEPDAYDIRIGRKPRASTVHNVAHVISVSAQEA